MIRIVNFEGAKAIVRNNNIKFLLIAVLTAFTLILTGCPNSPNTANTEGGPVDSNEIAATVNGKEIKLVDVEREFKQQAQGQESKLSALELASARLQILEQLIQKEVLFQKAEKEETIPKDEEVTAEINKMKTSKGVSKEDFEKKMKEADLTEEVLREKIKKELAINNLIEKVTGKIEPPSNSEIEAFYNGNKAAFVKKRGVKLAAIVIDPSNSGQGDTTTDEASVNLKKEEIIKKLQGGADFAEVATQDSEDPSRLQKGDLGYVSEEQMQQTFSPQIASAFMSDQFKVGGITPAIPIAGKFYIFKLQDRSEKDEDLTLESPGVRQQITDNLVNTRKQLLTASYAAMAMNEADIVNYLAKKVIDNPNELSGARPASPADDKKADTNTNTNTNINMDSNTNTNSETNANAGNSGNVNTKTESNSKANANK
ncbi:MAG: SurA N-terminal domain-containing protein [Aridibacter sp.]